MLCVIPRDNLGNVYQVVRFTQCVEQGGYEVILASRIHVEGYVRSLKCLGAFYRTESILLRILPKVGGHMFSVCLIMNIAVYMIKGGKREDLGPQSVRILIVQERVDVGRKVDIRVQKKLDYPVDLDGMYQWIICRDSDHDIGVIVQSRVIVSIHKVRLVSPEHWHAQIKRQLRHLIILLAGGCCHNNNVGQLCELCSLHDVLNQGLSCQRHQ